MYFSVFPRVISTAALSDGRGALAVFCVPDGVNILATESSGSSLSALRCSSESTASSYCAADFEPDLKAVFCLVTLNSQTTTVLFEATQNVCDCTLIDPCSPASSSVSTQTVDKPSVCRIGANLRELNESWSRVLQVAQEECRQMRQGLDEECTELVLENDRSCNDEVSNLHADCDKRTQSYETACARENSVGRAKIERECDDTIEEVEKNCTRKSDVIIMV